MKKSEKDFIFISNTRAYQPNHYGDEILLEYADQFTVKNVADKHLIYQYQMHEADSEESYLGLGLIANNMKSWFGFSSKKPEILNGYLQDKMLFAAEF